MRNNTNNKPRSDPGYIDLVDLRHTADTEKGGASTLLFSFASLELRLSEPAKPAVPTESGYPQGHRSHKNEHSAGAA